MCFLARPPCGARVPPEWQRREKGARKLCEAPELSSGVSAEFEARVGFISGSRMRGARSRSGALIAPSRCGRSAPHRAGGGGSTGTVWNLGILFAWRCSRLAAARSDRCQRAPSKRPSLRLPRPAQCRFGLESNHPLEARKSDADRLRFWGWRRCVGQTPQKCPGSMGFVEVLRFRAGVTMGLAATECI